MDIKIADVMTPTEAQNKNNILGIVAIEIVADDGSVLVKLNGITVRKAKDGTRFLAMPSYKIGKEGQEKWLNYYKMFPSEGDESEMSKKQRSRMDKLAQDAMRILDNGGTRQRTANTPTPVAAAKTSNKKEPWDV